MKAWFVPLEMRREDGSELSLPRLLQTEWSQSGKVTFNPQFVSFLRFSLKIHKFYRYVDFGNEETVNSHKLRRLHGKFRRMPCLAVPVFIPVQVKTKEDAEMLQQELEANIRYTEMKLSVLEVSREGKQIVNLDFMFGASLEDFIVELLK